MNTKSVELTKLREELANRDEAALQLVSHLCNQHDKDLFIVGSIKEDDGK